MKSPFDELPRAIVEHFGVWHVLRKWGFQAEEIGFCILGESGDTATHLKAQDKELFVRTGPKGKESMEDLDRALRRLEEITRTADIKEIRRVCRSTMAYKNTVPLVVALLQDGFFLPYKVN